MNRDLLTAHYKCCKCEIEYYSLPGPTECPACGNFWVEWLNYNKLFGDKKNA